MFGCGSGRAGTSSCNFISFIIILLGRVRKGNQSTHIMQLPELKFEVFFREVEQRISPVTEDALSGDCLICKIDENSLYCRIAP